MSSSQTGKEVEAQEGDEVRWAASALGRSAPPARRSGRGAWHLADAAHAAVAFTLCPREINQIVRAERPHAKRHVLVIRMGKPRRGKGLA